MANPYCASAEICEYKKTVEEMKKAVEEMGGTEEYPEDAMKLCRGIRYILGIKQEDD